MLRDVDVLVAEVDQFGPVLVVVGEVADLHLVDEGVLALVLDIDWALFASSGRTKFEDSVVLTTRSPASMAAGRRWRSTSRAGTPGRRPGRWPRP